MLKKILNVYEPIICTNQCSAFLQAVLMAHPNVSNMVFTKYLNLFCEQLERDMLNLEFINADWDFFRNIGIAEMNLYHRVNIEKNFLGRFIRERIDQNNYILLYEVDEFYIPYAINYKTKHFKHDTYIFGYEEENFYVMAYINDKLQPGKICEKDLMDAFYSKDLGEDTSFCSFRINDSVYAEFSYELLIEKIQDYLEGIESDEKYSEAVVGIKIYEEVLGYLNKFIERGYSKKDIDLKVFRTIWEHKKMMLYGIRRMSENQSINLDKLIICEKEANLLFYLILKYRAKGNKEFLEEAKGKIIYLQHLEREALEEILQKARFR